MSTELKVGAIYHWLGYEDEDLSKPMITSLEYLGLDILEVEEKPDRSRHFFRVIGTDEKVMFAEKSLPNLVDVPGLIKKLQDFQAGKHLLPPEER